MLYQSKNNCWYFWNKNAFDYTISSHFLDDDLLSAEPDKTELEFLVFLGSMLAMVNYRKQPRTRRIVLKQNMFNRVSSFCY